MLLGRLRIRGKLALLVIIPLLSMIGLAVPVVLDRVAAAQRAGGIAATVRVASRIGSLVQDLQQERLLSVGLLLGRVTRTELIQQSTGVDDRVADLRAGRLPDRVAAALDGVRKLADLRTAVLAGKATPTQIMEAFGPVDMALIEALRLPFGVDTGTSAGRQVLALDALLRADEGLGACATLIVLVKATSDPEVSAAYIACMSALQVDNQRFRGLITAEQYELARLDDAAVAARTTPTFLVDSVKDPVAAIAAVVFDLLHPRRHQPGRREATTTGGSRSSRSSWLATGGRSRPPSTVTPPRRWRPRRRRVSRGSWPSGTTRRTCRAAAPRAG